MLSFCLLNVGATPLLWLQTCHLNEQACDAWISVAVFLGSIPSFRPHLRESHSATAFVIHSLPLPPPLEMELGWPPDLTCVLHAVSGPEELKWVTLEGWLRPPSKCTKTQRTEE